MGSLQKLPMHSEEFVRGFPTPFEILYLLEGYQLPLIHLKEGCPIHVKKGQPFRDTAEESKILS